MRSDSPRSVLDQPLLSAAEQPATAVVLGAGVAGLLSAHVACRHFERVVLVERDRLQNYGSASNMMEAAKQRPGIPQFCHAHTLAMGGLEAMEQLMPGFQAELVRRGGLELDLARDFRFYDFGGAYVRGDSSLKSVGASRHLIQATLQEEVLRRNSGKLHVLDGCRASGLVWSEDRQDVLGVELEGGEQLRADLVIEASGRNSRLPLWLKEAGHASPPVKRVDCRLTYVGRIWRMPADWDKRWLGHITFGRPHGLRGGGMVPVEGGLWQMVLWGINGVLPPTDSDDSYLEFARSLPDPELYNAISRAEPLTPLMKYGGAYNLQRCYHQIQMPAGLAVIGDAALALNPVYAQGMSVAAQSAVTLDATLAAALGQPSSATEGNVAADAAAADARRRTAAHGVGPAFQARLAAVVAPAWMMATSEDMRYPGTKADGVSRPPRLLAAYIDALLKACQFDLKTLDYFFSIAHMVRPPHHMFQPHLLAAAVRQMVGESMQQHRLAVLLLAALAAGLCFWLALTAG